MTLLQEELLELALNDQNTISNNTTTTTTNNNNQSNPNQSSATNMQRHCETALLAKLQEMVPIMPRERELTKLEIINYVIDYIRHLKELVVIDNSL